MNDKAEANAEGNLFAKLEGSSHKNHNQTYNYNAIEQLDIENPLLAATQYDDLDNFHRLPTMEENRITQEAIAKTLIKEDYDGMEK